MATHNRKLPTEENEIRYSMHSDGLINQSKEMVTEMIDFIQKKIPQGTSAALGATVTVMAVAGSLALSEVIVAGLAAYCIGKTIGNWATSSARDVVNKTFNDDEKEN